MLEFLQTIFGRKKTDAKAEQVVRDVKAKRLLVERASHKLEKTIDDLLKTRKAINNGTRRNDDKKGS